MPDTKGFQPSLFSISLICCGDELRGIFPEVLSTYYFYFSCLLFFWFIIEFDPLQLKADLINENVQIYTEDVRGFKFDELS